ncbi:iron complex transport system permease protein [Agrobacterium vitis]|nr:iron complex transport system permease protein [Agrobacterium vitis]MBE1436456.1 iron complex transport system permease protein [Agrobacterium vitis]
MTLPINSRLLFFIAAPPLLLLTFWANISIGASWIALSDLLAAITHFDADNYDQAIMLYQRLPRALISIYVGATMAVSGAVLQGLTRNPLASPSTLGINAGAALFVVGGAFVFHLGMEAQGWAALAGAFFGFVLCAAIPRFAGRSNDPRGLTLILSGALVSMLFVGLTNAFLLSDPARRSDFLGWVTGNINHVYADRLSAFWWIGAISLVVLGSLAKPLTLMLLGDEKATSAGVNVKRVSRLALGATVLASGSAVAICGPIGFVGLVVPHMVRPLVGSNFAYSLPACGLIGACVCLLADLLAREAFQPYVLHTGLFMDLLGGVVFVVIVKRFYLSSKAGGLV